jgi:PAS domain S-box-containing protein
MVIIEDRQRQEGPDAAAGETAGEAALPGPGRAVLGALPLAALLVLLYAVGRYSVQLFHAAAELFSVIIAVVIFAIAWNSRRFLDNHFYLFIGIASLFVGVIDLLHLLVFRGMEVVPGAGSDAPTQLWIAGRYLQGVSLLIAPFFLHRTVRTEMVIALYAVLTGGLVLSIFVWRSFPACTVDGTGLTAFTIGCEYLLAVILAGAVAHLLRRRSAIDPDVLKLLIASVLSTIVAELLFAVSGGLSGHAFLLGRFCKLLSFYLLYRAMIETALVRPQLILYRRLTASEKALREERNVLKNYLDIAGVIIVALKSDQTVALINRKGESVLGHPREDILGKNWFDLVVPQEEREASKSVFDRMLTREAGPDVGVFENSLVTRKGERRLFAWHTTMLRNESGAAVGTLSSGEDITERKKYEDDQDLLIQDLRTVLDRVKMLSGLLPICSSCKKVRDDTGYWSQVETYIEAHTDAHFTHGICPDCAMRLYPHLFENGMPEL